MDPLHFVGVLIVIGLVALIASMLPWWRGATGEALDAITEVARRRGLPLTRTDKSCEAASPGRRLVVAVRSAGPLSEQRTRINLKTDIDDDFGVAPQGKLVGVDLYEASTGIEDFDARFSVASRPGWRALVRLGSRARTAVEGVRWEGFAVRHGLVDWEYKGLLTRPEELLGLLDRLEALVEALSEFDDRPAAGLLHHSFEDPDEAFRRRCFEALLREFPNSAQAAQARTRGAASTDPVLRFLVAREAEDLLTLEALVVDGGLPEELQVQAAGLVGPRLGGRLSVKDPADDGGELSLESAKRGALSKAAN